MDPLAAVVSPSRHPENKYLGDYCELFDRETIKIIIITFKICRCRGNCCPITIKCVRCVDNSISDSHCIAVRSVNPVWYDVGYRQKVEGSVEL
jgi:hypothetical protein